MYPREGRPPAYIKAADGVVVNPRHGRCFIRRIPGMYLKKADALFPATHLGCSCSWGHIAQALCQTGKAPPGSPMTILRW